MQLAIHKEVGSFSDYWIPYFERANIPFKIVSCYDSDIVEQLNDCDALLWHHNHGNYRDVLFAKSLLFSLQQSGKKVFPNFETAWHFDDKVGQKYLFECLNLPAVPAYVFYDKRNAFEWINYTTFPKVFKLRGGAGSANVSLVRSKSEAIKKVNRAFGRGFSQFNGVDYFIDCLGKFKEKKLGTLDLFKAFGRIFITTEFAKMRSAEKGYAYFQEFVPNNDSDIRIIVIGSRAFAIKRMVRKDDFRASGSGTVIYDKELFDRSLIALSFEAAEKLETQCCAFDFVFDENNKPLIVEISYGFASKAYFKCPGYWTRNLDFIEKEIEPHVWMVEDLIASLKD
ncbi:MAG: hypothetical protein EOO43_00995 [Flavobacterium sp.]|nr:MAG: hypothetical protein EOO43_00995 [Flavobacterium sp.]